MKPWIAIAATLLASICAAAQTARKPCEDLKAEIAKKLDDKGVVGYSLDIVDKGKEGDGKVVGSCDGGTKSIVYSRSGTAPKPAGDEKKPQ